MDSDLNKSPEQSDEPPSLNESRWPTCSDLQEILRTCDFKRMPGELEALAATATTETEWFEWSEKIVDGLSNCCDNSDSAALHILTQLPNFHVAISQIISQLHPFLNDDPLFLAKLRDAILPHVREEHESKLVFWLRWVIKVPYPVSVREFYDTLWSKAFPKHTDHLQILKDFYTKILLGQKNDITDVSIIESVVHIGIARHQISCLA